MAVDPILSVLQGGECGVYQQAAEKQYSAADERRLMPIISVASHLDLA